MVEGKGGIQAKMIADSVSPDGVRLCTLQLRYPRFIHAEFMTHRMFERNAASNRAVPVWKNLESIHKSPARPIFWGLNQKGMQAHTLADGHTRAELLRGWLHASRDASNNARFLDGLKAHKQIVNRVLEPFQFIDVIVTATEWENFFNLRRHDDAQPEIQELARVMKEVMDTSEPKVFAIGNWHLPYVTDGDMEDLNCYMGGQDLKEDDNIEDLVLEAARDVSGARCARVSFLNHDKSNPVIEKDLGLADGLLSDFHMSPFGHQATPMRIPDLNVMDSIDDLDEGETHVDKEGNIWSGCLRGWVQYRQIIQEERGK